jgi:copper resistance protein B
MDNKVFMHVLFDQFEGRTNGSDSEFRWDGQVWAGTDMNKLWLKSEGFVNAGKMSDGDHEALYDRPIPVCGTSTLRPEYERISIRDRSVSGVQ